MSAGGNRRPPQKRRRKPQGRFYAIIAAVVVVILIVVLIIVNPFKAKDDPNSAAINPTPTDQLTSSVSTANIMADDPTATEQPQDLSLAEQLASEDYQMTALSEEQMAKVDDLSINTNLPSEWMNVLLLGTDERTLTASARTDSMMICSINTTTGDVKLTSIMRDLAIDYDDIGQYNGTYRINAANYFGGPELAMKTVNEHFGMNIQYYVMVNFFGFQEIAERLGGIEIDITEAEMEQINKLVYQQAKIAYYAGVYETGQEQDLLETYGENVHLNGWQTLAYARIRKIDNDYMRSERQRLVLTKLLDKLKLMNPVDLLGVAQSMMDQVKTNMEFNDIVNTAMTVMSKNVDSVETFRLPVTGTYKEERRNEQDMLYDCDWNSNTTQLYNFIYE